MVSPFPFFRLVGLLVGITSTVGRCVTGCCVLGCFDTVGVIVGEKVGGLIGLSVG